MQKLNPEKIKGVLFDLGGTLIYIENDPDFRSKHIDDRFREITTPDDLRIPFDERIKFIKQFWLDMKNDYFSRGEDFTIQEFTTGVLRALGYSEESVQLLAPKYEQIIFDYEYENTVIFPGADELLSYLKQNGYKIGLISNTSYTENRVRKLMRKVDIEKYFDLVMTSADMRCSKPNPAIFHKALSALDLKPDEAIYIGDRPEFDQLGAENAGLGYLLVNINFNLIQIRDIFSSSAEIP